MITSSTDISRVDDDGLEEIELELEGLLVRRGSEGVVE
jgi:hypothetical protein